MYSIEGKIKFLINCKKALPKERREMWKEYLLLLETVQPKQMYIKILFFKKTDPFWERYDVLTKTLWREVNDDLVKVLEDAAKRKVL